VLNGPSGPRLREAARALRAKGVDITGEATAKAKDWEPEGPPDTRGRTTPLPLAIHLAGWTSLLIVTAGTALLQVLHASSGQGVSARCVAWGVDPAVRGASGVCHILEAIRSHAESVGLVVAGVVGLAAIAVGFGTYRKMPSKRQRDEAVSGAMLGVLAIPLIAALHVFRTGETFIIANNFLNFDYLKGTFGEFLRGAKNTLTLAVVGELGGIAIGIALALLVISERKVVRAPARGYINFFRGTPLIWQLSAGFFGVVLGLQIQVSVFHVAIAVFALNTGAYAAEVFRAGLQSIERGQIEAARSLGMSYTKAMRYAIVPQAVRRVIPALLNEFVILIKDTSLITILGLLATERDLFSVGRDLYSSTFNATPLVAVAAGYLVVTLPLIGLVNAVERRVRSGLVSVAGAGV
jgi:polar amino acid transport system permease protein